MISTRGDGPEDLLNTSGMRRANIRNLYIKLDANSPFMLSFNELDLYKCTKNNGMVNYNTDFLYGKNMLLPNVPVYKIGANVHTGHATGSLHRSELKQGTVNNGNIVLIRWGGANGVPLPASLSSSVGGLQSNITISGVADSDEDSSRFVMYVVHFYERELVFTNDFNCAVKNELYTRQDVMNATNIWANKVDSGKLYLNNATFRGSGLLDIASKVGSYIPKIAKFIKTGIDYYNNNSDAINGAVNTASNAYNAMSSQPATGEGRKALGDILQRYR
jgi:hypothetical protein